MAEVYPPSLVALYGGSDRARGRALFVVVVVVVAAGRSGEYVMYLRGILRNIVQGTG